MEKDEFALRAKRIEIPASITGLPFYQRLGYSFKDGKTELDDEHLYRLEKYVLPGNQQTVLDAILHRRSYRGKYKPERIPREHLKAIIQKVFGLVFTDNDAANAFWEKQGYSLRTNLNYRNKSLNDRIPTGE